MADEIRIIPMNDRRLIRCAIGLVMILGGIPVGMADFRYLAGMLLGAGFMVHAHAADWTIASRIRGIVSHGR